MTLPNISPGGSRTPIALPSDFDIFSTPSVPTSSGSVITTWGSSPSARMRSRPTQQVEELVRAAELDVRLERHRVVALGERVEQLVERDRLPRLPALLEVVALEDPRDRDPRGEAHEPGRAERAEPPAVELDDGLLGVEDLEGLLRVGPGVLLDLLAGQLRPRRLLAGRVADHRR